MADKKINIILDSRATGDGFERTNKGLGYSKKAAEKATKASTDLTVSVKRLGNVFGDAGSSIGGFVSNLLKGGVWGMATEMIRGFISYFVEAAEEAKRKAEEAMKKVVEQIDSVTSHINSYKSAVAESAEAARNAADAAAAKRRAEIDLTERLTKAEIELTRQRRIAAGENADTVNGESDAALREQAAKTARARADAEVAAAERRLSNAQEELEDAQKESMTLWDAYRQMKESHAYMVDDEQRAAHGRQMRAQFAQYESANRREMAANKRLDKETDAVAAAMKKRSVLEKELEAQELKAANEKAAKEADAAKKTAEERQKAEIAAAQAAAQAAAKERERLDREAHQKRMADLRAEIDVQNKAKASQSAIAAAAQSEFERAFAMYRDPERAAQEIGEEKARSADLDRLHKDARRYGGQWRIDELSALMSAGDTQGVQSRLQEWRKNGRFDASTEALVRASAAEKTRTTAEDELRKISANTAGLAAKLDELIAMKE